MTDHAGNIRKWLERLATPSATETERRIKELCAHAIKSHGAAIALTHAREDGEDVDEAREQELFDERDMDLDELDELMADTLLGAYFKACSVNAYAEDKPLRSDAGGYCSPSGMDDLERLITT